MTTNANAFADISDLAPLTIDVKEAGPYLLIFNAPHAGTWQNVGVSYIAYNLVLDGVEISRGVSGHNKEQKRPMTLMTVKNLQVGTHTLKSHWWYNANGSGGGATLNNQSHTWLIAAKLSGQANALTVPAADVNSGLVTYTGREFADIPGLSLNFNNANPGMQLLALNMPAVQTSTQVGAGAWVRLLLDDTEIARGYVAMRNNQTTVINLMARSMVSAGDHTLRAQWANLNATVQADVSVSFNNYGRATLLNVELKGPSEATVTPAITNEPSINKDTWTFETLPSLPLLNLTLNQPSDVLVLFNVPEVFDATSAFRIRVGNHDLAMGSYYSGALLGIEWVPNTVIGATTLAAGTHSFEGQWGKLQGGSGNLGRTSQNWLIAFEP